MSEDEMEKFEITDYDLNNEFYRGRKKLTKHQQIYGNKLLHNYSLSFLKVVKSKH